MRNWNKQEAAQKLGENMEDMILTEEEVIVRETIEELSNNKGENDEQ